MSYKAITLIFVVTFFWSLERVRPFIKRNSSSTLNNIVLGLMGFGVVSACGILFDDLFFQKKVMELSCFHFLVTFFVLEIINYWWHRLSHKWHFLWRFHKVHHSDLDLESTSAFRFHFGETLASFMVKIVIIKALSLSIMTVAIYEIIFLTMNVAQHANINVNKKLNIILSTVFITPSLHRKHHDKNPLHQNYNFSTILSVWDRLFGTYSSNDADVVKSYGLENQSAKWSFQQMVLLPFYNDTKRLK